MKKTFPLQREGRHPDRVLDALKHELRKYMARERGRPLPPETDFWDFDCRFGASEETAQPLHPGELNRQLDALAQGGATQCYVELLAKPVRRKWEARAADAATDGPAQSPDDADTDEHPAA
jgi:hypothetical protein